MYSKNVKIFFRENDIREYLYFTTGAKQYTIYIRVNILNIRKR